MEAEGPQRGPSLTPSKKAWSSPHLTAQAAGPPTPRGRVQAPGASTLLEALDAMKRCNSEHHFGSHPESWVDDILGRRPESPDTTLASFHSKQCSQESLESQAEELLRAMKSSSNLGTPCSLSNAGPQNWGAGSQTKSPPASPAAGCPQAQQSQQQHGTGPAHAAAPVDSQQPCGSQTLLPPAMAASSSGSSSQPPPCGHSMPPDAEQAIEPCTTSGQVLPGCHFKALSTPAASRSSSEPQHEDQDPGATAGSDEPQLPPASTPKATSPPRQQATPPSRSAGCAPPPAMRPAAPPAAPYTPLAPRHLPPAKPYLISRSQTCSPGPQPKSALTTSAPAPSGHLTPGSFESSSSDDCEEVTRRITAAFPKLHSTSHERHKSWSAFGGRGSEEAPRLLRSQEGSLDGSSGLSLSLEEAELLERRRNGRGNYHLTGPAAAELLLRLNHARQTVDFVKRQAALFSSLNRASMDVWEALDMLDGMHAQQSAHGAQVEAELSPRDHAFQTAELCRLSHPDHDWLHLVGLIHGLGKLLSHRMFGSQPEWATLGESFPLGCRFDPSLQGAQFFSVNPDRRRRMYNSALGIYPPACGLRNVYMSWSAAEYLYLLLLLNDTRLPPEALFMIRYQSFGSVTGGNGAYRQLLSPSDEALLPLLASFQQLCVQRRVTLPPDKSRPREEQQRYYEALVHKYLGQGRKLSW